MIDSSLIAGTQPSGASTLLLTGSVGAGSVASSAVQIHAKGAASSFEARVNDGFRERFEASVGVAGAAANRLPRDYTRNSGSGASSLHAGAILQGSDETAVVELANSLSRPTFTSGTAGSEWTPSKMESTVSDGIGDVGFAKAEGAAASSEPRRVDLQHVSEEEKALAPASDTPLQAEVDFSQLSTSSKFGTTVGPQLVSETVGVGRDAAPDNLQEIGFKETSPTQVPQNTLAKSDTSIQKVKDENVRFVSRTPSGMVGRAAAGVPHSRQPATAAPTSDLDGAPSLSGKRTIAKEDAATRTSSVQYGASASGVGASSSAAKKDKLAEGTTAEVVVASGAHMADLTSSVPQPSQEAITVTDKTVQTATAQRQNHVGASAHQGNTKRTAVEGSAIVPAVATVARADGLLHQVASATPHPMPSPSTPWVDRFLVRASAASALLQTRQVGRPGVTVSGTVNEQPSLAQVRQSSLTDVPGLAKPAAASVAFPDVSPQEGTAGGGSEEMAWRSHLRAGMADGSIATEQGTTEGLNAIPKALDSGEEERGAGLAVAAAADADAKSLTTVPVTSPETIPAASVAPSGRKGLAVKAVGAARSESTSSAPAGNAVVGGTPSPFTGASVGVKADASTAGKAVNEAAVGVKAGVLQGQPEAAVNSAAVAFPQQFQGEVPGETKVAAGLQQQTTSSEATAYGSPRGGAEGLEHTTLVASPNVLEVGVASGTNGWLKVRAEMDGAGGVSASVVTTTVSAADALHKELPSLSAYLRDESVGVSSLVIHRAEGGALLQDSTSGFGAGSFGAGTQSGRGGPASQTDGPERHEMSSDGVDRTLRTVSSDASSGTAASAQHGRASGGWLNVVA